MKVTDITKDVIIEVWDAGMTADTIIGCKTVCIKQFIKDGETEEWIELFHES